MNNDRRKVLAEAKDLIEQESFDNLPEGLQQSERGEQMEENVSNLESSMNSLDEVISCLEEL